VFTKAYSKDQTTKSPSCRYHFSVLYVVEWSYRIYHCRLYNMLSLFGQSDYTASVIRTVPAVFLPQTLRSMLKVLRDRR
jgi:hypothetical protein